MRCLDIWLCVYGAIVQLLACTGFVLDVRENCLGIVVNRMIASDADYDQCWRQNHWCALAGVENTANIFRIGDGGWQKLSVRAGIANLRGY